MKLVEIANERDAIARVLATVGINDRLAASRAALCAARAEACEGGLVAVVEHGEQRFERGELFGRERLGLERTPPARFALILDPRDRDDGIAAHVPQLQQPRVLRRGRRLRLEATINTERPLSRPAAKR